MKQHSQNYSDSILAQILILKAATNIFRSQFTSFSRTLRTSIATVLVIKTFFLFEMFVQKLILLISLFVIFISVNAEKFDEELANPAEYLSNIRKSTHPCKFITEIRSLNTINQNMKTASEKFAKSWPGEGVIQQEVKEEICVSKDEVFFIDDMPYECEQITSNIVLKVEGNEISTEFRSHCAFKPL
jgi:hypothetical protein